MSYNNTNKTNNMTSSVEKTIVAFHTGRGGHFYNPGHVSFIGEQPISDFTNELFEVYENASEVAKAIGDRENLNKLYQQATEGNATAYSRLKAVGLDLGELVYADGGGNLVGLTKKEAEKGIGTINIDNDYDTTTACYLADCSDEEFQLIVDSERWVSDAVVNYCKEQLGIEA